MAIAVLRFPPRISHISIRGYAQKCLRTHRWPLGLVFTTVTPLFIASIALNVFVSYSDFNTICIAIKGQERLSLLRKLPSRSKVQGQMQNGTMVTPKWQKF